MTQMKVVRSVWSWPAIVAIFALLAMPVVGGLAASAGGALLLPICTSNGPHQIALGGDGQPVPTPPATHGKPCWFCIAHPGWLPTTHPGLSVPVAVGTPIAALLFPVGISPPPGFLAGRRTRAPPAPMA